MLFCSGANILFDTCVEPSSVGCVFQRLPTPKRKPICSNRFHQREEKTASSRAARFAHLAPDMLKGVALKSARLRLASGLFGSYASHWPARDERFHGLRDVHANRTEGVKATSKLTSSGFYSCKTLRQVYVPHFWKTLLICHHLLTSDQTRQQSTQHNKRRDVLMRVLRECVAFTLMRWARLRDQMPATCSFLCTYTVWNPEVPNKLSKMRSAGARWT